MNKSTPQAQNKKTATVALVRALLVGTCIRYTVISLFVLLINLILQDSAVAYVEPLRFLLFIPFALTLTLATRVRSADKLPTGAKVALHPLAVLGGFYLCMYLPFQLRTKPSGAQVLIALLLAAVVYGIALGVIALVTRRSHRKEIETTPYVSQFGRK